MSDTEIDTEALRWAPSEIKQWVDDCEEELKIRPRRLDVVTSVPNLDGPPGEQYTRIGIHIGNAVDLLRTLLLLILILLLMILLCQSLSAFRRTNHREEIR